MEGQDEIDSATIHQLLPPSDSVAAATTTGYGDPGSKKKRGGRNNKRRKNKNKNRTKNKNDNGADDTKGDGNGGSATVRSGKGGRAPNSYLKIIMDDASLDIMHRMAEAIRNETRAMAEKELEETEGRQTVEQGAAKQSDGVIAENSQEGKSAEGSGTSTLPIMGAEGKGDQTIADDSTTGEKNKAPKPKRPKRPLTFKPRSRRSLHMTFFFGGTVLCELPGEELQEWHGKVMGRLAKAKLPLVEEERRADDAPPPDERTKSEADEFTLSFKELTLFPPRRNSLIVAIFEGSPALHRLHDDLRDTAKEGESEMLASVVQRSKERWTAHVTIGDIRGGKKSDLKILEEKLLAGTGTRGIVAPSISMGTVGEDNMDCSDLIDEAKGSVEGDGEKGKEELAFIAKVRGVAMGGPVPQQLELNWDFFFDD